MLRIVHTQLSSVLGPVRLDDCDDGLPHLTAHRGATGNPKADAHDGYSDKAKQPCYVPRTMASMGLPLVAGYIDLRETDRVKLSAAQGKIAGFKNAGIVSVISFTAADVAAPTVASAVLATDLTITGTNLDSLAPNESIVTITGTGAKTLTKTQILAVGGASFSNTSIVIKAASIPGVAIATSSVRVKADLQNSAIVAVS